MGKQSVEETMKNIVPKIDELLAQLQAEEK